MFSIEQHFAMFKHKWQVIHKQEPILVEKAHEGDECVKVDLNWHKLFQMC